MLDQPLASGPVPCTEGEGKARAAEVVRSVPRGAGILGWQWEGLSSPPGQVWVEEQAGSSRCL